MLTTSLTRFQARSFSSAAGMVQFRPETTSDGFMVEGNDKMIHTGMSSVRLSSSIGKMPTFTQEPLGAALRVSPFDEAAERYQPGDEFNAFVYTYDLQGDNESPLLVLTADDPRGKGVALGGTGTFGSSTRVFKRKGTGDLVEDPTIERELSELGAGDGPYEATVVAVSDHSSAVFVDCGVGRKRGKKYGGGTTKVLGMLRFEDIKEGAVSEDDLDMEAGDEIKVYIKAVSPQSGRFMVTLDPSIKNKKPKDLKREKQADKRKERLLSKQISEVDIQSLIGNEYDAIVKAKSKTGDCYYVQPFVEGEEDVNGLPVGIANFVVDSDDREGEEGQGSKHDSYSAGDRVRVRLEGIDEKRGQLAMTLLD
mmetsp:Transcript_8711/g.19551  ORF Transcript_8711/g.19551 Transcript_8711/m.19551 type:complete len:366 (+) Transcript_8711:138-1235(+)